MPRDIKPKFEVEVLEGDVEETYFERDTDRHMNVEKKRNVPAGWMVYMANGTSMRVRTWEEMVRLGFNEQPGLIDMESGEPYAVPGQVSLKRQVQRQARQPRQRADTASKEASGE